MPNSSACCWRPQQDLEIIFSRFGNITACDIIRDWKTGDSLNYAFIGFDSDEACEEAFFKMNNCLIDDRRIKASPLSCLSLSSNRSHQLRSLHPWLPATCHHH